VFDVKVKRVGNVTVVLRHV